MKILKKTHQYRRDFEAIIKCEFCDNEEKLSGGYDDHYYHTEVLPDIKCDKCKESTNSKGGVIDIPQLKYAEGYQI